MLVLTRRVGESIRMTNSQNSLRDICITVGEIRAGRVKLSFKAPAEVTILREELYKALGKESSELNSTLEKLCQQADEAAESHGHELAWCRPYVTGPAGMQFGQCIKCNAWVRVNTRPLPTEKDVDGPAVVVECKD